MLRKGYFFLLLLLFSQLLVNAQATTTESGTISGTLIDEKQKPITGASVELILIGDSIPLKGVVSDKDGGFSFYSIAFGKYRIKISSVGFKTLSIDSVSLRADRYEVFMNDVVLKKSADQLQEVVVFAEKPVIENKEGNITFNASESSLSAGSNASDLLKNVPLVAADPDGKITVKGKEPKILIDDKPVELNAQQLQDFLESMPGSMIERIEVMTNPPPQYANEPGGVINIVTRKGKAGKSGRISVFAGTRGEKGANGSFTYRKRGFSFSISAGMGSNIYQGNGYSRRENIYTDSSNYLNTDSRYRNLNKRPGTRMHVDYDLGSRDAINAVISYNKNIFDNNSNTRYTNLNQFKDISKLSERSIQSDGYSSNPSGTITYTHRGKNPGETLRFINSGSYSHNENNRYFYQQFFNPDYTPNGIDSTQQQFTTSNNYGYATRLAYDKMFANKTTFLSAGGSYNHNSSRVVLLSEYFKKPDSQYVKSDLLSNDFKFIQTISNLRFSMKQLFGKGNSVSAGLSAERTTVHFDLYQIQQASGNSYWTFLPFFNFNKQWEEILNLTLSYRRTIRRPGMGELNPAIDFGDPYNLRFGNIDLQPSTSHNFDLVLGRNKDKYYINLSMGFNLVQDVYAQIRTLQPDGKTFVTWKNIDDRKEYGISSWSGYNFSKKLRVNGSISYTYNQYSKFDQLTYKYRNGSSINSGLNANYAPDQMWNFNAGATFNRFANPQGYVRWNSSMNIGLQRKFFEKRFIITANIIDPLQQQENRTFTYGTNFNHESYGYTRTRNYRLTLTYNFIPRPTKADLEQKQKLKMMVPKKG